MKIEELDLWHRGHAGIICTYRVGDVLIDPGPERTHRRLLDALPEPPRAILLTHIHFDHAGAVGTLLGEWPSTEVWVHERGARHLIAPDRLVASARRVFGDAFGEMWGEVVPVDAARVHALRGGERISGMLAAATPGHASHHVAYLDEDSGVAFVGDVAGVRLGGGPVVLATPPPDVDIAAWENSLNTIAGWQVTELALSHYGRFADVDSHLQELRKVLAEWPQLAARLPETEYTDFIRQTWLSSANAADYELASPPESFWTGLRGDREERGPTDARPRHEQAPPQPLDMNKRLRKTTK